MSWTARLVSRGGVAALILAVLAGCSKRPTVTELPPEDQNLRSIAMAYGQATTNLGRPPKSVDELKPVLKEFGDPDKLLVSPRDGQPYVIVGGISLRNPGNTSGVVAYERDGKDGVRKVVDARLVARDVTAAEFAALKFPPGHSPPR